MTTASGSGSGSGALPPLADRTEVERLGDPGERGSLTVADRVVEKIAARAASEIATTITLSRRMADRLPGRQADPARVVVSVSGRLVRLQVTIAIRYPASVVDATRAVRNHVSAIVGRLCDVDVREVDVVVTRMRRGEYDHRGVA